MLGKYQMYTIYAFASAQFLIKTFEKAHLYIPVYFLRKWPLDKDVHHRIVPYCRCILDAAVCAFFVALSSLK